MSVSTFIIATLHGGPHDGDTLTLRRSRPTFELIDWQGCYLPDAGLATYRRVSEPDGGFIVHYEYVEPDDEIPA